MLYAIFGSNPEVSILLGAVFIGVIIFIVKKGQKQDKEEMKTIRENMERIGKRTREKEKKEKRKKKKTGTTKNKKKNKVEQKKNPEERVNV